MTDELILYDIANRHNACWNTSVWKARMVLNFKNIPYRTEWLEYPDIAPTLTALGVPAHGPESGAFVSHTLPTIRLPGSDSGSSGGGGGGTEGGGSDYVMDSRAIAEAVERRFPTPTLHLDDDEYLPRMAPAVAALTPALKSGFMARVPRDVLNPRGAEYWSRTRGGFLGMSVDDFERTADKDAEWEAARPHLELLAAMLKEREGPFFLGREPGFADIVLAAYLRGTSVYSGETFQKVVGSDQVFKDLFDAAQPWMQKNGN